MLATTVASQNIKTNQARPNSTLITPTVTLSSTTTNVSENGGIATITATLSAATNKDVYIDFSIGGTSTNKVDYKITFPHYAQPKVVAGGNGEGSASNQLYIPSGIFVDNQKKVYVADAGNSRIQKWAYGATTGQTHLSSGVTGIFIDSLGNTYVADRYNHRVQKWTPGASVGVTVAGGNGQGTAANQLTYPQSVYVDKTGNVFVNDRGNARIQKWAPGASVGTTIMGVNRKVFDINFTPMDIYGDKVGNIYVGDYIGTHSRILKWNASSNTVEELIGLENPNNYPDNPIQYVTGIHVDDEGNIFICDGSLLQVRMFKPNSKTPIILVEQGNNNINEPTDIFVDKDGNVYCSNYMYNDVRRFQFSPQIYIPAGQTTGTLTVTGINDLTDEFNETVILTPTATNATLYSATPLSLTIIDDDPEPTLNFNLAQTTINEEASAVDVILSLSRKSAKDIRFKFSIGGTAINGVDYTLSSDSIAIAAGDSLAALTITPVNDNLVEVLESIQLGISSSINLSTVYPTLTAYISSEDTPSVALSASLASFSEASGQSTITATLDAPTSREVVVNIALTGTAIRNTDYQVVYATSGTSATPQIVIPAGQTTGTLLIKGLDDLTDEFDESVILTPTATNATIGTPTTLTLTIVSDDSPPVLSFSLPQTTINEESAGADVTVSLSRVSAKNIGFKLMTSGTAIKGTDYTLSSDSLVIPAGQSYATFKIIPINDTIVEIAETIQLGISSSVNVSTVYPTLTAYISSEDKPSMVLTASANSFTEVGGTSTIKATLSSPTSRDIIVNIDLSGTAQYNTDYLVTLTTNGTAAAPQMIIPAGQTSVSDSIKVKGIEDWLNETDESIILTPTSANAIFPNGALTLTIKENRIQLTQQATPFPALTESAISWGDYDRDGDQDLAIMGTSLATGNVTRIYRNDNGVFVNTNQNLFKLRNGDIQWVDINKDGYLDLIVSGIGSENNTTVRKTILYISDQGNTFTATSDINVVGLSYTKLAFGDLDNDGDLDLAILGKNESNQSLFYLYEKLDNQLKYQIISDFNPGVNISAIVDGDLKVADFDLDGDNDIIFKGGYIRNSYNETGDFGFALSYTDLRYEVSKVFNDTSPLTIMGLGATGGSNPNFGANTYLSFLTGNVARKNGAIAAGDFNNDGLTDILVSGENAAATGQSQLYYQKSNGSFELSDIALAALRNSTADWVDYDVDGDLDLIMTGIHATNGQTTVLYKNDAGVKHNQAPAAPTNLTVTDLGNGFVKLSWDKPSDDYSTFLGYNIRLGTSPGGTELSNPQSNLQNGSRLITAIPPIYTNSYITQLSPGKYYWSVQAIDQGFQGSPFAAEQIYILQYDWKLINQRGIVNRSINGVDKPKLTLLDIDNDKDLDLILGSSYNRQAYLFDDKIYRPASLNIGFGGIENLVEGDINNDGLTDVVINSTDKILRVYFNTGGNFSQVYTVSATGLINTKLKLVDMDNDGLMDIMMAGITSTDDNGVPKFYRMEWQGIGSNFVFSDLSSQIASLKYASYDFGDFNKDKKIDFVTSGYDENEGLKSILYQNTTIADSTLTLTPTTNEFVPVNQGTTDLVDYDGDGDLDIIFTGMIASGPDVFQVYENQLVGENATFVPHTINIGSLRNAKIRFGDFNGDGLLDIFYTGFRDGVGKVTGLAQYNATTKNYEASTFNYGNLTDAEFAFGDIENDGDLDMILTGNDVSNASNTIFRALLNVQNESASVNTNSLVNAEGFVSESEIMKTTLAASETYRFNTAPSIPKTKSLKLLTVANKKILEFAWLAATDDNTPVSGLSYNLRIGKTTAGDEILAANAGVNGVRKIAGKGNTEHNLSWNIKMLPNGTYYWSVQAIDASFIGSAFTTPQKFEIINGQLKTYQAPVVSNSTFTTSETIAVNTVVGKVQATDPENDPLTYQIVAGNNNNWFEINATGQIILKNKSAVFPNPIILEVKVKDGLNEVTATITIKFCETNFTVTQNLISVTKSYQSTSSIQAANKITGASVVSYEAKKSVLLSPGFMADKGVAFSALINGGCTN
ncbi:FG-GAP-like repeat-containing protein [Emticicia agri]|nr:FG-GAP-like repeat-containing protein [Emticicia agri]